MKKLLLLSVVLVLSACNTTQPIQQEESRTFHVLGQDMTIVQPLLGQVRSKWGDLNTPVKVKSALDRENILYTLDYIALMETLNNKECPLIHMQETRSFDPTKDVDTRRPNQVYGAFDEIWVVKSCEFTKKFRVINIQGTNEVTAYPI